MSHLLSLTDVRRVPRRRISKPPESQAGLSLTLSPGERLGLTGQVEDLAQDLSAFFCGLKRPRGGEIWFEGKRIDRLGRYDWRRIRHRISILRAVGEHPFHPDWTIGRSVEAYSRAILPRLPAAERERLITEAWHLGGADRAALDLLPHQLTPLHIQRAALARAFISQPEMVLAVDPLAGLGASERAQIADLILATDKIAWLILTPQMAEAAHLAPRIGVVRKGRIVETGRSMDLLLIPRHPYTRLLVNTQPDLWGGVFDHPRPVHPARL